MVLDFTNIFVIVFLAGTGIAFIFHHILEYIDYAERKKNGGIVPKVLQDIPAAKEKLDEEKLKRISSYENEKYFLWIPSSICSFILTICLVLFGFYPWLFTSISQLSFIKENSFLHIFLFFTLGGIPASIISLPFGIYRNFKLEKKYGFSNMTFKLWLTDSIKGILMSLILNAIMLFAINLVLNLFPSKWWLFAACVMFAFGAIMTIIYPKFIAPIFNKFSPLEEGELKSKIEVLLSKTGFVSDGLFVMDASKRSNHSNAYFTGFGKTKRIVLYDTLINQLSTDELVAVLGHELGHYKLKHIAKRIIAMFPLEFIVMLILFLLAQNVTLYNSFGFTFVTEQNISSFQAIGLFLSILLFEAVSFIITPVSGIISRKNEYAADKMAAEICGTPEHLISALVKLNSENLSELLPPKIYSFFMYSHPTLVERVTALKKLEK